MKQYEKWWAFFIADRTSRLDNVIRADRRRKLVMEKNKYEEGWKAALRWTHKQLKEDYEQLTPGDTGWMGKFIEKELEE